MNEFTNILMVAIDNLRSDYLGCYSQGGNHTAHLDRLTSEGIHFANFFLQSSWPLPSFASIFSGRYPWEHRFFKC